MRCGRSIKQLEPVTESEPAPARRATRAQARAAAAAEAAARTSGAAGAVALDAACIPADPAAAAELYRRVMRPLQVPYPSSALLLAGAHQAWWSPTTGCDVRH